MGIDGFRIIDNKIYILASALKSYYDVRDYTDNIIVLDKTSKSTLYIGEYKQGNEFKANSYILKKDEL